MTISTGALRLSWTAAAGQNYQVQFSPDLFSANWSNWGNTITATNGEVTVAESVVPTQQQFYRVVLLP